MKMIKLVLLLIIIHSASAHSLNNESFWSIKDAKNLKGDVPSVHVLTRWGLWAADGIWSWLPSRVQNSIWQRICPHDSPCPVNESFSGDFNALQEKGILQFVLDALLTKEPGSPWLSFRLGPIPMIVPLEPKIASKVLLSRHAERGIAYDRLVTFFGEGIFTGRNVERWKHQRHITMQMLHGPMLKNMAQDMYKGLNQEVLRASKAAQGAPIDLVLLLSRMGLFAFCDSVLQVDVRDIADELAPRLNRLLAYVNGALEPMTIPYGEAYNTFIEDRDFVHHWMLTVVERIRLQAELGKMPNNPLVKEILSLTESDQQDELIELMIANVLGGHETTARLMLGAMYAMMKHKTYIDNVRLEMADYLKSHEEPLDYDAIFKSGKFLRLNTIIEESLRLFPPVWLLARSLLEDLTISDNLTIQKGTQVLISLLVLQRQESVWGPDAEIFYPERFDNLDESTAKNFFPFALGKIHCPGEQFAKMESMLAIAGLFHHFDMRLADPEQLPDPRSAGTFRMFNTLPVIIAPRSGVPH